MALIKPPLPGLQEDTLKTKAFGHHGPPELHGVVVVEQVGGGRVVVQGGRSKWSVGS